ncbi:MAG TPA: MFS transporter [Planctomycetota bacterium]|nr:MFS transporter [Planctomycetota bacterium]
MSETLTQPEPPRVQPPAHWWSGLTGRQWLVLIVAYLGWVFDIMDVYLLTLVKDPCMTDLLGKGATKEDVATYSGLALSLTLIGWSIGGLIFGVVADRWGRSRTMALTIIIYSVFTGLAGFAQNWWQLFIFRFIAALGIGGEWSAGASLIAEVFPLRSRAVAAGILQSASATGFFAATFLWRIVGGYFTGPDAWRYMFFAGAIPALLAVVVRMGVHEPETWVAAKKKGSNDVGSLGAVFGDRELRRRTLLGTALATIGIFAYWGTTYWGPESLKEVLAGLGIDSKSVEFKDKMFWGLQLFHVGILTGFLIYIPITGKVGRRWAFGLFYLASAISLPVAFLFAKTYASWLVLFFIGGMFSSGIYSGYTIYFPELFPTRVRATGAGFCYNVGRVVAAPGPFLAGILLGWFGTRSVTGAVIGAVYILGLLVIPFLPETQHVRTDVENDDTAKAAAH